MRRLLAVSILLTACAVHVPDDVFRCSGDDECPATHACVSGYCHTGPRVDAGVRDAFVSDAALDAPVDAAVTPDTNVDGGACTHAPTITSFTALGGTGDDDTYGMIVAEVGELVLADDYSGHLAFGSADGMTMGNEGALLHTSLDGTPSDADLVTGGTQAIFALTQLPGAIAFTGSAQGTTTLPAGNTLSGPGTYGWIATPSAASLLESTASSVVQPRAIVGLDGSVCIGGSFSGMLDFSGHGLAASAGGLDGFVACFDAGTLALSYGFRFGGADDDTVLALAHAGGGELWVAGSYSGDAQLPDGTTATTMGATDGFVMLVHPATSTVTAFYGFGGVGGAGASSGVDLAVSEDTVYVVGTLTGSLGSPPITGGAGTDAIVIALDMNLIPRWGASVMGGDYDRFERVVIDGCGHVVAAGGLEGAGGTISAHRAAIAAFDPATGAQLWLMTGTTAGGYFRGLASATDGRLYAVGRHFSPYAMASGTPTLGALSGASDLDLLILTP